MERTFVMIEPDGVRRGLVGEVILRIERRGLTLAELKLVRPSRALAEEHYGVHRDKPFFQGVVNFITSGPVVAIACILAAVFIPVAFLGGISGQIYRQFALTIVASVLLSAFNALSLSPALSAMILAQRCCVSRSAGKAVRQVQ